MCCLPRFFLLLLASSTQKPMIGLKILSFTSHIHVLVCPFELFLFSCLNPKHFLATTMMRPVPHTLNSFKWTIYGVKCVSVWWWMLLFTTHPRGLLAAKDWVDAIFPLDLAHKRRAAGRQTKKRRGKALFISSEAAQFAAYRDGFYGGRFEGDGSSSVSKLKNRLFSELCRR